MERKTTKSIESLIHHASDCGKFIAVAICLSILISSVVCAQTAEQRADQMLALLKERQYFDLIDHYLFRLSGSEALSAEWKANIPFERASALIQLASSGGADDVDDRLEEARKLMKAFAEENSDSPRAADAEIAMARVRKAQGDRDLAKAMETTDVKQQKKHFESARTAFRSAERQFRKRKNTIADELKAIRLDGIVVEEEKLVKLNADLIEARMTVALLELEQAKLDRDAGKSYDKQLTSALEEFGKISKEFKEQLAGLEAVFYQGVCYEEIGQYDQALDYYEQLLQLVEIPEPLGSRMMGRIISCYVKLEQPFKAIKRGEIWLARGGERMKTSESAQATVSLCEAYYSIAQSESGRDQQKRYRDAREQLMRALKIQGPHESAARALLAKLPAGALKPSELGANAEFANAKLAAEQVRDQMQSTATVVELARRKAQTAEDDERRATAETELKEAEQNLSRFQVGALKQYRAALSKADANSPIEDVNQVRYMVAFLNYQLNRPMEAAAVASFVGLRYPDSQVAKDCSNLAMASYWQLYQAADGDREFETKEMIRVADHIAARWPEDPEAQSALMNLVNLTIAQGDAAKAEEYLNKISEDSAARWPAQLRTGSSLYRLAMQPETEDRAAILDRAQTLLTTAIEKSRDGTPDANLVQAVLSLASIHVEGGRAGEALTLLSDEKIGPKSLVEKKHPSVQGEGMVERVYRVQLKALIGQISSGEAEIDKALGEASETMASLKKLVGDSTDGQKRLTATYVALAKDLRAQMESADDSTRAKLRGGFKAFLNEVAGSADSMTTKQWVAETYMGMADDIVASLVGQPLPDEAREYYEGSLQTFRQLVALPDDTPGMSPELRVRLNLQMANTNRRLGNHKEAIDLFDQVLRDRNRVINVQVQAAETFQEAAEVGSNNLYELAIRGARENEAGEKVIWGWQKLANIASAQMQKSPEKEAEFGDLFFKSRFNVALCRMQQARRASGEEKKSFAGKAAQAIRVTRSLYPELGGPEWQAKFEQLSNEIKAL